MRCDSYFTSFIPFPPKSTHSRLYRVILPSKPLSALKYQHSDNTTLSHAMWFYLFYVDETVFVRTALKSLHFLCDTVCYEIKSFSSFYNRFWRMNLECIKMMNLQILLPHNQDNTLTLVRRICITRIYARITSSLFPYLFTFIVKFHPKSWIFSSETVDAL